MAINQFVARNGLISLDDTIISGSLYVSQSVSASAFTGSLFGTASWAYSASNAINAQTASYSETASYAKTFLTPTYIATGSITASVNIDDNSFQIVSGSSTFLHISSSGYVGIGTTIQSEKLQVAGNIFILTGSNSAYEPYGMLKFANPAYPNNYAAIQSSGYAKGIDAANLVFITNPGQGSVAKAVLSGGGNLMIGGTLSFSSSAYHRLDVDGSGINAAGSALRLNYDGATLTNVTGGAHIFLENDNNTGQNVIVSFIKNKFVGKIRNSYDGDMNYVVSGSGGHYFWTGGDTGTGSIELSVLDNNVTISASLNITGSTNQLGNINITGSLLATQSYISTIDYIDFSPNKYDTVTPGTIPTHTEGRLFYDTGSQTLCMYNSQSTVTLNIGQESWLRARNQTGTTIANGSVVKISGAVGNRPSIILAQAIDQVNTFGLTNDIIGMATHDIINGTDGFVTTFGIVNGVDTNAFNAGDLLWVSQSAGQYTNIPPIAPYDKSFVGVVTRKGNSNVGSIFVTPQQPLHFHDLSSVSASTYTQGDIWMFRESGSSGTWTNTKSLSGSYVISGSLTVTQSINFTNLTTQSQQWVLTYNSASGQIYYTASSALGGGGSTSPASITIKDEGINLTTAVSSIDFVGSGVTATNSGNAVTVTINTSNIDTTTFVTTSSFNNFTSSAVTNSQTASFLTTSSFNSWTGSNQSQFAGTASYTLNAANAGISQGKIVAITTGLSNLF